MKKACLYILACLFAFFPSLSQTDKTASIRHTPYGYYELYDNREVSHCAWKRVPRKVLAGEKVTPYAATPIDSKATLTLLWQKSGVSQPDISCRRYLQKNGLTIWRARMGAFEMGDKVACRFYSGEAYTPWYTFAVRAWVGAQRLQVVGIDKTCVTLRAYAESMSLRPLLYLSVPPTGGIRLSTKMQDGAAFTAENTAAALKISRGTDKINLTRSPATLQMGGACVKEISFLSDGTDIAGIRLGMDAKKTDQYLGFGQKFNTLNHRGTLVDIYTVNWYTAQAEKSYAPIPYYLCAGQYGFYLNQDVYAQFDMGKSQADRVLVALEGDALDCVWFSGDHAAISRQYADFSGHARMLPEWAFGLWISANEWNRQTEAENELRLAKECGFPVSVLVLEAWSDEETFYTFSDSRFTANSGDQAMTLSDFTFAGRWPDPKAMVDFAHANGTRVLLWQIPVLKKSAAPTAQSQLDERYAIAHDYVIKNADGTPYRMPNGWFGQSLPLDFTNKEAAAWFLQKRAYLLRDIGIDGFKTDGGEFVYGKDTLSFSGLTGHTLRNAYPDLSAQSNFDFSSAISPDAVTFSRSGGRLMNRHPALWMGDQRSSFEEMQACLRAMLNLSVSNVPFAAWDLAGFSDALPTSELYQRATALAAFCPIMQLHAEASGDSSPSMARTPWNMAKVKNDPACLTTFQKFSAIREQLRPYLIKQALQCAEKGVPLMRPMAYAYPADIQAAQAEYQYLLGDRLLICPVMKSGVREISVYLPAGQWQDPFSGEVLSGGQWVTRSARLDEIAVFLSIEQINSAPFSKAMPHK